jgi:hypothetical protein
LRVGRPKSVRRGDGERGLTFCIVLRTIASVFFGAMLRAPFFGFRACFDLRWEPPEACSPFVEF